MTAAAPDPRTARAVLIGVDEYQGGPAWSLAGPVDDAVRFAEFFVTHGVPPEQVTVLAAPMPAPAVLPAGVDCRRATSSTVRGMFIRDLATSSESTLYVLWGGHGYVDLDRHRRLLFPDATDDDPVDLDLDSLLRRFGTDQVRALNRQVWLVDACQVHGPGTPARIGGHETFAAGDPVPGRAQDVYLAAGFGQPAVNLSRRRTGLFSREVLTLLNEHGLPLLTDPPTLTDALQSRFAAMRATGSLSQTPTYLWYRHAIGNEGQLLRRPESVPAPPPPRDVPPSLLKPVVDALTEIEVFRRPNDREEILSLLRGSVYGQIRRNPAARLDAIQILRTCLNHPGALSELVEAVRFFAPNDEAVAHFEAVAASLKQ
ncbi:effector-associated domain 2-containing protein [Paractinoplanes lichenicola]|uniref:Caspase family protein n=1 Tax=Paractinoplanes lichenicola TaxID=2802976 RepID=A0ABS1VUV0_9ACTN|nr:caspase family protein [Actinoplanes lichenicola]MBL7258259.1 caspase family protein [Actinoplanes lichenicola]